MKLHILNINQNILYYVVRTIKMIINSLEIII